MLDRAVWGRGPFGFHLTNVLLHMVNVLLLFVCGGVSVLLFLPAIGALAVPVAFVFLVFEVGLVATLQAFIFSILTSIYIGGAVAETH